MPSPPPPRTVEPPLPRRFYDRPTARVARDLLGCRLVRSGAGGLREARIVETEAYVANDPASHAFRGPTRRNRSMFERPGTLYVFRIHQVYCANAVTCPGEAVLLRAAEPVSEGLAGTRGPGRLCRAFSLTVADDGADLTRRPLCILPRNRPLGGRIVTDRRVGISRGVERLLRFAIEGNAHVSTPRPRRATGTM